MNVKAYIALFLIPLFLMKLLIIDSNGLSFVIGEDVELVHPTCAKAEAAVSVEKTTNFSQMPAAEDHTFSINVFCPTQFDFEIFSWNAPFSETIVTQDTPFSAKLNSLYLDNTSPPPRLS